MAFTTRQDDLTFNPSLSAFALPKQEYLKEYKDPRYDHIAVATFVFDHTEPRPRLLLLQRAAHDSLPNRWEVPGGGCDDEDESILIGAARELWEEAGLRAERFLSLLGGKEIFTSSSGKRVCRFSFLVEAHWVAGEMFDVKLDPNEHQNYVWATADEISKGQVGDVKVQLTTSHLANLIADAFSLISLAR